jgi:hypothetical protein
MHVISSEYCADIATPIDRVEPSLGREASVVTEGTIIRRLDQLHPDRFSALLAESEASGYRFLRRVADEWESGANRFARLGEALLAAEFDDRLIGVCGTASAHSCTAWVVWRDGVRLDILDLVVTIS